MAKRLCNFPSTHRNGPWGGNVGAAKELHAMTHPSRLHIKCDFNSEQTINLRPTEFIREVSGTYGRYEDEVVVRSFKIVTNMCTYGPFGREKCNGTSFCSKGTVVGFHGRSGDYLNSIGTYTMSQPTLNGPWGGSGGSSKRITGVPRHLESITICSGWVIDSLEFSYISEDGQRHTKGPWGGDGGSRHTINLRPTEFIREVSGTYGRYEDEVVVRSFKIVTNMCTYGPFGREKCNGTSFCSKGTVVGFHGRSGDYLNSIGTYTMSQPTLNGPWGGSGGSSKRITGVPRHLESITICSGWVIDSLEFSYISEDGQRHTKGPWGGDGGSRHTINLRPTEFIREVSGTYGRYEDEVVVRSLKIVTNMCTYGPFGREKSNGTSFCSNGTVVGFHGRSGNYLNSIGTYTV